MKPSPKSRAKPKPDKPAEVRRFAFEAIGTAWTIDIYEQIDDRQADALLVAIKTRIAAYDAHYSRFRDDSLIATMAAQGGVYQLPDDARPLFDLYEELYALTDGAVTPLIGQTLADAGYDASYSLTPKPLSPPPAWDEVLTYRYPHLELARPALLDVGAAGKGHLVDIIGRLLEHAGLHAYCIDAGGDMRYRSPAGQPLRVGLEHPADPKQAIGVATILNQSLCGSSGNRRDWGAYHHIIDPHALVSPRHIRALWVVADSTLLADGLTTALFFVPADVLRTRYTFEYALVTREYALHHSNGFPATFFTANTEG